MLDKQLQIRSGRLEVVCHDGTKTQAAITVFDSRAHSIGSAASTGGFPIMPRHGFASNGYPPCNGVGGTGRLVSPTVRPEMPDNQLGQQTIERFLADRGYKIACPGTLHEQLPRLHARQTFQFGTTSVRE